MKKLMILLAAVLTLSTVEATAQIGKRSSNVEVVAKLRLGNVQLTLVNGKYILSMPNSLNSSLAVGLASKGVDIDTGTVTIELGVAEQAAETLKYLAENKMKKGQNIQIDTDPQVVLGYSALTGGWQFGKDGKNGNLSRGEAKSLLKRIQL